MDKKLKSMEPLEKYSWLDEYLDSFERSFGFMDLATLQPTSSRHFQPLVAKEWLDWLWNIINEREKQNVSFQKIAESLEPALCRIQLLWTSEDLKAAHWPLEKRLKVADFFYQALKARMPQGDLFGLNGTTRWHSQKDIEDILKSKKFNKGSPEIAREFGKLYNGAYQLCASLFLDFYMDKGIENWGPYYLNDGRLMVIKRMHFLNPTDIWPEIKTQCNKATLFVIYKNVKFSTDAIPIHTQYEGDIMNGLDEWCMEVDGKAVDNLDKIKELGLNFAQESLAQWTRVVNLPEAELLDKCLLIRCFCFNRLCELLKLDWKPPESLQAVLKGKTLEEGWRAWHQPTEEKAFNEYWRKIWDPRIDFYP